MGKLIVYNTVTDPPKVSANGGRKVTAMGYEMEELLSPKEVCKLLKVLETWPYKMAKHGRLPYYKLEGVVRFKKSDIEAFLEEREKMKSKKKGETDLGANKACGVCRGCLKRTDGKIDWLIHGFCETCRPR